MLELAQLAVVGIVLVGIGALIVSRIRQRSLVPAILIWLLAPLIVMIPIFALGALTSPASGTPLYGLVFAVMLIGTIILVPWLVAASIGVGIGLVLRRKRLPEMPFRQSSPNSHSQAITDPLERADGHRASTPSPASEPNRETALAGPGPFAAWRTALVLLVGALIAIALLSYLSVTYGVDPPKISTVPHIPRLAK